MNCKKVPVCPLLVLLIEKQLEKEYRTYETLDDYDQAVKQDQLSL